MEPFVRYFLRSSLIWLGVGVILAIVIAFRPYEGAALRPAHAHANLLGFVSMMIFGVAYHVLPRFTGAALHSRWLAGAHLWVANLGLALLVVGWSARVFAVAAGGFMIMAGALVSAAGAGMFIFNIWRTLDASLRPVGIQAGRLG
jgi:heme/copper-type cytochrome/quinol oxidase subunit 1